jgi:hypothetical protein
VDAAQALADLVEISSQIESAVLAGAGGTVEGTTLADTGRAEAIAKEARELLDAAAGPSGPASQVQVSFREGCVFAVTDGERLVVAVTGRDPTAGLVFYDLKTCLRMSGKDEEQEPTAAAGSRRRKKKDEAEAPDEA